MLAQLASGATATEHALMGHVTGAGQLGLHARPQAHLWRMGTHGQLNASGLNGQLGLHTGHRPIQL